LKSSISTNAIFAVKVLLLVLQESTRNKYIIINGKYNGSLCWKLVLYRKWCWYVASYILLELLYICALHTCELPEITDLLFKTEISPVIVLAWKYDSRQICQFRFISVLQNPKGILWNLKCRKFVYINLYFPMCTLNRWMLAK